MPWGAPVSFNPFGEDPEEERKRLQQQAEPGLMDVALVQAQNAPQSPVPEPAPYDPFQALKPGPENPWAPKKPGKGILGGSFGVLDPKQQMEDLDARFARHDRGQKQIANLERMLGATTNPYQRRAIEAQLNNARSALPDLDILHRMEAGDAPLATKTGLRTAVENAPRAFGESVLSIPEFVGIVKGYLGPGKVDDDSLVKWSLGAKEQLRQMLPGDEARAGDFGQQLASGLGQIASFYGAGALAALLKAGPKAAAAVVAAMGSAATGSSGFEEGTAELKAARDRAQQTGDAATVTELDRLLKFVGYSAIGVTEAIPVARTFSRAVPNPVSSLGHRLVQTGEGAIEEALQESGSQVAQNLVTQATTNPNRPTMEGVAEGGAVGGVLGGLMNALMPGKFTPPRPAAPPPQAGATTPGGAQMAPGSPGGPGLPVPVGQPYIDRGTITSVPPDAPAPAAGSGVGQPAALALGQQAQAMPAGRNLGQPAARSMGEPTVSVEPPRQIQAPRPPVIDVEAEPVPPVSRARGVRKQSFTEGDLNNGAIGVDAQLMQFKEGGDREGVTDRLKGVKEWDAVRAGNTIVYEYADGRRIIADGHQRLGLAKRLASEGKQVDFDAFVFREADGFTPQQVRQIAAIKNIAEGSGTSLDAAKVLRELGTSPAELNLPPNSALARDAAGLAKLGDDAFGMVVNEIVPKQYAAIVGQEVADPTLQTNIMGLLARLKPSSALEARAIVSQARQATVESTQENLFGAETNLESLYGERAKVLAEAARQLRANKRVFQTLLSNEKEAEKAGNVLNRSENERQARVSAILGDIIDRLAYATGPISSALTAAARDFKSSGKLARAGKQFADAVTDSLARGEVDGLRVGGVRPESASAADQGQAEVDTDTVDMFGGTTDRVNITAVRPATPVVEPEMQESEGSFGTGDFLSALREAPRGPQYPIAPRDNWYGDANYEQTGGRLVQMTPDEYLAQARPMPMDELARENVDDLKRHIQEGGELDPLALYKNGKEDGRHRAIAAKELGIKTVPVLDFRPPAKQTDTPAFKSWFGDSKVTDEQGQPLVVYHGTRADIEIFDKELRGSNTGTRASRGGFFFSSDPGNAEGFSTLSTEGAPNVMPVFLRIENPLTVDMLNPGPVNMARGGVIANKIEEAKAGGHDGLVLLNAKDNVGSDAPRATVFMAFEPNQIKSSIGNRGTFDPNDDSILHALSEAPKKQTETPEFKRWFGTSKVVDESGSPIVVYHGTARGDFASFDTYGGRYGLFGQGGYFTEDPTVGSEYTEKGIVRMKPGQAAQTVYPVYLKIENPIDMDAPADAAAWAKAFDEFIYPRNVEGMTNEEAYREVEGFVADEGYPAADGAEIMQDGLRGMGFDGITHMGGGRVDPNGVRHRVWIAFDPSQIKSKFNRGRFDPNNDDMLAALGSVPKKKREIDPLGYYSKALEEAKDLKQERGTGEQMFAMLERAGVKNSEIEATGLDRFLLGDELAQQRRSAMAASKRVSQLNAELTSEKEPPTPERATELFTEIAEAQTDLEIRRERFSQAMRGIGDNGGPPLDGMPSRRIVTKTEIVEQLRRSRVKLQESRYGGMDRTDLPESVRKGFQERELDDLLGRNGATDSSYDVWFDDDEGGWTHGLYGESSGDYFDDQSDAEYNLEEMLKSNIESMSDSQLAERHMPEDDEDKPDIQLLKGPAEYRDYSLDEDNSTYRESVLHLPVASSQPETKPDPEIIAKYQAEWDDINAKLEPLNEALWAPGGRPLEEGADRAAYDAETKRLQDELEALQVARENLHWHMVRESIAKRRENNPFYDVAYKSGHWDEPNAVAHVRTAIFKDTQGRKVFNIDELQSDWGQKIREGGAIDPAKIAKLEQDANDAEIRIRELSEQARALLDANPEMTTPILGEPKPYGEYGGFVEPGKNPEGAAMYEGRHYVKGVTQTPWNVGNYKGLITYWPETFDGQGNPQGRPLYVVNTLDGNVSNARYGTMEHAVASISERVRALPGSRALSMASARALNSGNMELSREFYDLSEAIKAATSESSLKHRELQTAKTAAPAHPLINTTDQWVETAMRRLIRQAVDAGADGISLTPGKVQNDRYKLSGTYDRIDVLPKGGVREVHFYKLGNSLSSSISTRVDKTGMMYESNQSHLNGQPLSAAVGAEIARTIMAVPLDGDGRRLDVAALEVGGQGMKATYDVMYPRALAKALQKFDKSIKPERTYLLPTDYNPNSRMSLEEFREGTPFENQFIYFPLTAKAKEALNDPDEGGQPLFALAGVRAKTADQSSKQLAESMEAKGRDPRYIFRSTGWLRGPDLGWRFEIDDSAAKIVNLAKVLTQPTKSLIGRMFGASPVKIGSDARAVNNVPLTDLLHHPKLFQAYPFLRKMRVDLLYGRGLGRSGALRMRAGTGNKTVYLPIRVTAESERDILSVLLHEIQHYIQNHEGFAQGSDIPKGHPAYRDSTGNRGILGTGTKPPLYDPSQRGQRVGYSLGKSLLEMTEAENIADSLLDLYEMEKSDEPETRQDARSMIKEYEVNLERVMRAGPETYDKSFGEYEARLVQNRMDMTAEQRRNAYPLEDMPEDLLASRTQTRDYQQAYDEIMRRAMVHRAIKARWRERRQVGAGIAVVRPMEDTLYYFQDDGKEPTGDRTEQARWRVENSMAQVTLYPEIAGATPKFKKAFYDLPYAEQKPIADAISRDIRSRNMRPAIDGWQSEKAFEFWKRYDPAQVIADPRLYRDELNAAIKKEYGPEAELVLYGDTNPETGEMYGGSGAVGEPWDVYAKVPGSGRKQDEIDAELNRLRDRYDEIDRNWTGLPEQRKEASTLENRISELEGEAMDVDFGDVIAVPRAVLGDIIPAFESAYSTAVGGNWFASGIDKDAWIVAQRDAAMRERGLKGDNALFALSDAAGPTKLAVVHNLSAENLAFSDALGGLAVPSMAVLKEGPRMGIGGFGEITLIGREELADPTKNPVFDADAWSMRFPKPDYPKVPRSVAQPLLNQLHKFEKLTDDYMAASNIWDYMVNDPNPSDLMRAAVRSTAVQSMFLATKGITVEPVLATNDAHGAIGKVDRRATETRVNEQMQGLEPEFQNWINGTFIAAFGRPTMKLRGRRVDYTLDNIVDAMTPRKKVNAQEDFATFSEGKARAIAAKRFKSLEVMRKAAATNILSEAEVSSAREIAKALMENWRMAVVPFFSGRTHRGEVDTWDALDASMRAAASAAQGSSLAYALRKEGFVDVPQGVVDQGMLGVNAFMAAPVPYFESKPQRAVDLKEFAGALIPENASEDTKAILTKHGIPFRAYKDGFTKEGRELFRERETAEFIKELAGEGQDTLFSVNTSKQARKENIVARIRMGFAVDVPAAFGEAVHEAIAPLRPMVPEGTIVGTLLRLEPIPELRNWVKGVFKTADGHEAVVELPQDALLDSRAFYCTTEADDGSNKPGIFFVNLSPTTGRDQRFRGEWVHETVHLLRQNRVLSGAIWAGLVNHAKNLQVMNVSLGDYLDAIGAEHSGGENYDTSIGHAYRDLYQNKSRKDEFLDQESVTHMLELLVHGVYTPEQLRPVLPAVEAILSGKYGTGSSEAEAEAALTAAMGGKDSQGQSLLKDPAFKAWFGDSKVVDAQGNPLVLYHGTKASADFSEFSVDGPPTDEEGERSSSGSGVDPTAPLGAHFAQEPEVGNYFAGERVYGGARHEEGDPRVMPVYLSIQKPWVGSETQLREMIWLLGTLPDEAIESYAETMPDPDDYLAHFDELKGSHRANEQQLIWDSVADQYEDDGRQLIEELATSARLEMQTRGYDGVKYKNEVEGGTSWIAFKPTQIKSAFNRGTFDPDDPDILHAFAGKNAETADLGRLNQAMEMQAEGEASWDIWKKTGWMLGLEGEWKFEIDDSKSLLAKMTPDYIKKAIEVGGEFKLGEILNHPKLMAAYPWLKEMRIRFSNNIPFPDAYFQPANIFEPESQHIGLGIAASERTVNGERQEFPAYSGSDADVSQLKSSLLHEIQHAIQQFENFNWGSDPAEEQRAFEVRLLADKLTPRDLATIKHLGLDDKLDLHRELIDMVKEGMLSEEVLRETLAAKNGLVKRMASALYQRSAGEIEARLVQHRMDKPQIFRQQKPPRFSSVYPPEQVRAVRFSEATAANSAKAYTKYLKDAQTKGKKPISFIEFKKELEAESV